MSLLSLPNEVLEKVVESIGQDPLDDSDLTLAYVHVGSSRQDRSTLCSLARTCRRLSDFALRTLYQSLRFWDGEDMVAILWSLLQDTRLRDYIKKIGVLVWMEDYQVIG